MMAAVGGRGYGNDSRKNAPFGLRGSNSPLAERGFMSKVWLITGASRGLGRAFTQAVLDAGDRVVATARNPEQLVELQGRYSGKIRTVALDVTNEAQAKAAFQAPTSPLGFRPCALHTT